LITTKIQLQGSTEENKTLIRKIWTDMDKEGEKLHKRILKIK
jgi:hypothetical protein